MNIPFQMSSDGLTTDGSQEAGHHSMIQDLLVGIDGIPDKFTAFCEERGSKLHVGMVYCAVKIASLRNRIRDDELRKTKDEKETVIERLVR